MREQEMRMRVFRFLKARMRNMIMPATVGIGLAVGGACENSKAVPMYGVPWTPDAAIASHDSSVRQDVPAGDLGSTADALVPDLAPTGRDAVAGADLVADSAPDASSTRDLAAADLAVADAAPSVDRARDLVDAKDTLASLDSESMDSGADTTNVADSSPADAASDVNSIITKYGSPSPDAGADGTTVVRYAAQAPDAAPDIKNYPMYMASFPVGA